MDPFILKSIDLRVFHFPYPETRGIDLLYKF